MSLPPNLPDDRDLAAALPEPPPPRPTARRAAIDAALRRFDGDGSATGAPRAPRPRWIGRPQVAALATIALVVAVAVPAWIAERERIAPTAQEARRPLPADRFEQPAYDAAPAPAGAAREAAATADSAERAGGAEREMASAPPAQPSATAPAEAAAGTAEPREMADSYADKAVAPPPPPAALAKAEADEMVVTAARVAADSRAERMAAPRSKAAAGDWTGCTVDDPSRSLDRCDHVADPAAKGRAGRAAARQADGLLLAWRDDYDGAIQAFGEAIDIAPLPIFYLNRGLAYRRKGDLKRALADADRAIQAAPTQARGYRVRSMFRREQGDLRGAEADAKRAKKLESEGR